MSTLDALNAPRPSDWLKEHAKCLLDGAKLVAQLFPQALVRDGPMRLDFIAEPPPYVHAEKEDSLNELPPIQRVTSPLHFRRVPELKLL